MPIDCHFQDCKALLVLSPSHVRINAIASAGLYLYLISQKMSCCWHVGPLSCGTIVWLNTLNLPKAASASKQSSRSCSKWSRPWCTRHALWAAAVTILLQQREWKYKTTILHSTPS